ncbi:MAG: serine hydrolase [Microbacterium enclense]
MTRILSEGICTTRFRPVRDAFEAYLAQDPSHSAQLCVYVDGSCVIDLAGGPDLAREDITGVFSVTKGVAALALATLVDSNRLDLDARVTEYWPEFALQGKDRISVRQMLSHQAGLPAPDGGVTSDDVLLSKQGAARLAASAPLWQPGSLFGYHGLTIGILMEELVRRVAGRDLQSMYESDIRQEYDIDFFLGLPEHLEYRYRPLRPPRPLSSVDADPLPGDTITDAAFGRLGAPTDTSLSAFGPNTPAVRRTGPAASGGVGSAHGLARLYSVALGRIGEPLLRPETVTEMSRIQVSGHDVVVDDEMRFAVTFMKPQPRMPFGSYRAFGHDGAGGALAFADPLYGMSFAYIPMPMTSPGGADARAIELSRILRTCLRADKAATTSPPTT